MHEFVKRMDARMDAGMDDDDWLTDFDMDRKAVWFIIGLVVGGACAFVMGLVLGK